MTVWASCRSIAWCRPGIHTRFFELGRVLGSDLGPGDGIPDGEVEGLAPRDLLGESDGPALGALDGVLLGDPVGLTLGDNDGMLLGLVQINGDNHGGISNEKTTSDAKKKKCKR